MDVSKKVILEKVDPIAKKSILHTFIADFNLTGNEINDTFDIKEYYVFSKLKDNFDYMVAPNGFSDSIRVLYNLLEDNTLKECVEEKVLEALSPIKKEELLSYTRNKIFISRNSFKEYLYKDFIISERKIIFEYGVDYYFPGVDISYVREVVKNMEDVKDSYSDREKIIDDLINRRCKLYSPASIRNKLSDSIDNDKKIYDTQLYRWLDNRANMVKFELKTISDEKPVIRYLVDIESFRYNRKNKNIISVDEKKYDEKFFYRLDEILSNKYK